MNFWIVLCHLAQVVNEASVLRAGHRMRNWPESNDTFQKIIVSKDYSLLAYKRDELTRSVGLRRSYYALIGVIEWTSTLHTVADRRDPGRFLTIPVLPIPEQ